MSGTARLPANCHAGDLLRKDHAEVHRLCVIYTIYAGICSRYLPECVLAAKHDGADVIKKLSGSVA